MNSLVVSTFGGRWASEESVLSWCSDCPYKGSPGFLPKERRAYRGVGRRTPLHIQLAVHLMTSTQVTSLNWFVPVQTQTVKFISLHGHPMHHFFACFSDFIKIYYVFIKLGQVFCKATKKSCYLILSEILFLFLYVQVLITKYKGTRGTINNYEGFQQNPSQRSDLCLLVCNLVKTMINGSKRLSQHQCFLI